MTDPEEALERARASAASMRAAGAYSEDTSSPPLEPEPVTTAKLREWALIEPDANVVGSAQRFGAPVTGIKRLLLRLLDQYHSEVLSRQARFNIGAVDELRRLEERIDALERKIRGDEPA
jgi:hypothetical protein